ncbi:hypothetical protein [Flavobacterium sp.]|uniref:hypothetical protein n=1 Tax=Flavobacterium sp. TaxID=239 RepID=UPI003527BF97
MKQLIYILVFVTSFTCVAQIGINTTTPHNSSALDVVATDKGVLIPRVTLTSTTNQSPIPVSVTPQESILVYNTATANDVIPGFYYWNGNKWVKLLDGTDSKTYNSPWYNYSSGTANATNTDNIYTNGTVSIGTNKVFGPLTVLTEDSENPVAHFMSIENDKDSGCDLDLVRSRGNNYDTKLALVDGDKVGTMEWKGVKEVIANEPVFGSFAKIEAAVDGATGTDDFPSRLEFSTTPIGATAPELVMRILNDGKIHFPKHTNWDESNLSSETAIAVKSDGTLVKIDASLLRTSPQTIVKKEKGYTLSNRLNKQQINLYPAAAESTSLQKEANNTEKVIVGTLFSNKSTSLHIVKRATDLSPLLLSKVPTFNSNDEAKKAGLKEGMLYKDKEGDLMIVF